ncbi:acyltransferase family protein, partial [Streptomonospora sediminis]
AVEEQFYLLWPLLFIGWTALPIRRRTTVVALAATLAVVAVSLVVSVVQTADSPQPAYFLPQTRMWELAVGGALAVALTRYGIRAAWMRWCLGWAGLAAIGAAAWYYSDSTPFPGIAAALPVLGAAAVIAAGEHHPRYSAYGLLSSAPARFGGDLSYALYLWHWPVIVFLLSLTESDSLSLLSGIAAVVLSLLLAWGTKVAVEDPVRRLGLLVSGRRAAAFAVVSALVVGLLAAGQFARYEWLRNTEFDPVQHVGPAALGTTDPMGSPDVPIYPSPVAAGDDLPDVYDDCQASPRLTTLQSCVYGPEDADTTVAVAGDSHAAQWVPALRKIAEQQDWRLHVFAKSSCAFTSTPLERGGKEYEECTEWNQTVLDKLTNQIEPDLVFTSSSVGSDAAGSATESESDLDIAAGMNELWGPLEDSGSHVVAIRDTPRMEQRLPDCVSRHSGDPIQCARPSGEAFGDQDPQVLAAANDPDTDLVDLTGDFCQGDTCLPVIGNVMVYRDSAHITATYSELLAPALKQAIGDTVDEL